MPSTLSDWSATDTALLGGALSTRYADVQTTKDLIGRGGQETNPLFGTPHPSGAALDQAGLFGGALITVIASQLSPKYRKDFLAGATGLEGDLAWRNAHTTGDEPKRSFGEAIKIPAIVALGSAALAHLMQNFGGDFGIVPTGDSKSPGFALRFTKDF